MRNNIVIAPVGDSLRVNTKDVYQYDYGLVLVLDGIDLPGLYTVQFCNTGDTDTKVVYGNSDGVLIPDEFLLTGKDIIAYVYLHTDAEDGETVYEVRIPVKTRAKITNETPTPVQQSEIDAAIAAMNHAVEMAEESVMHYPYIENEYWMVWDAEQNQFVNTGVKAVGPPGIVEGLQIGGTETLPPGSQATATSQIEGGHIMMYFGIPAGDGSQAFLLWDEASEQDAVEFSCGANNVALDDLVLRIEPVLSGSGTPGPRNVRNISGYTGLTLVHNLNSHTVEWPDAGTVYSGIYDALTGTLSVDKALITLNCTDMNNGAYVPGWTQSGIRNLIGANVEQMFTGQVLNVGTSYSVDTTNGRDVLYLDYAQYGMTQPQWKATEIRVQILVELPEPIVYHINRMFPATVYGQNRYAANTGKIKHIKYPCDVKLYIDSKV